MIRPMPDLENVERMAKLGRQQALKDARLDATFGLRDALQAFQSEHTTQERLVECIGIARECIDRIEALHQIGEWL